jgi:cytochrome c oxidase assembly protein Cox11
MKKDKTSLGKDMANLRWGKLTKKQRKEFYDTKLKESNRVGVKLSAHLRKKFGWKYWQKKDPKILRRIAKEKERFKKQLQKEKLTK